MSGSTIANNSTGAGGVGGLTGGNDGIANGLPGGNGGDGAGIWNSSTLHVTSSTISGNTTGTGGPGGCGYSTGGQAGNSGNGAGVWNRGSLTVTNSTLSGNATGPGGYNDCATPGGGPGLPGVGGGLLAAGGTAAVTYATIVANSDGLTEMTGAVALTGTIVANSTNANCAGSIGESVGYNLDSGASCAFSQPTDLTTTNPQLGSLADNGGPTRTMALLSGSPAIDHGGSSANGCPATDQRGIVRPQGAACDIGAYETAPQIAGAAF